jgi:hypothetical protein
MDVRERPAKTGGSYATALRHVRRAVAMRLDISDSNLAEETRGTDAAGLGAVGMALSEE